MNPKNNMNQQNTMNTIDNVDLSQLDLSSTQFLSAEQLKTLSNGDVISNQFKRQPIDTSDIPDLHVEPTMPNYDQRTNINNKIDNFVNKEDTIEQKINKDLNSIQSKTLNLPIDPKDILKSLIKTGEHKKDFKLFGHFWTLRALDQQDTLLAVEEVKDVLETQVSRVSALMFAYTVYSLEAIDGISIYEWFPDIKLIDFGGDKGSFMLAIKRALKRYMEAFPPIVIDTLYEKYNEVDKERNDAVEKLKNS